MNEGLLERHFTPDEIEMLYAITSTQFRAEVNQDDLVTGSPYGRGMRAWVETLSSKDPGYMERALAVATKYDEIDRDRRLHQILLARVMGNRHAPKDLFKEAYQELEGALNAQFGVRTGTHLGDNIARLKILAKMKKLELEVLLGDIVIVSFSNAEYARVKSQIARLLAENEAALREQQ